jgi:hypothetical protein
MGNYLSTLESTVSTWYPRHALVPCVPEGAWISAVIHEGIMGVEFTVPPGFELFHVVRLITRQDAANMLGMPSLCTLGHMQSTIPVVRTLYAMP